MEAKSRWQEAASSLVQLLGTMSANSLHCQLSKNQIITTETPEAAEKCFLCFRVLEDGGTRALFSCRAVCTLSTQARQPALPLRTTRKVLRMCPSSRG